MGIDNHQSLLFEFLLRQGDNTLVLGHRTSEWCGLGPVLEEDIALANVALDLIGQTQLWLSYAAEVENRNRTANDLAFLRDTYDFKNTLMMELPNEDFARTMVRQYLFDAFQVPWLTALQQSSDQRIAEISAKSLKECLYHLERSADTVITLGDGSDESHRRMQAALDFLWPYTGELFGDDEFDHALNKKGIAPVPKDLHPGWMDSVQSTLATACLAAPSSTFAHSGGRTGNRHTEHLGHMLATMQVLQRSHPGAQW